MSSPKNRKSQIAKASRSWDAAPKLPSIADHIPDEDSSEKVESWGHPTSEFSVKHRLLILIVVGVLLVALYECYLINRRSASENLVTYPNAQNLQTDAFTLTGDGTAQECTITFETDDPPETVIAYYEQKFTRAGWSAEYQREQWPTPSEDTSYNGTFSYGDRSASEGLATYTISIETKSSADGKTQVTLHQWKLRAWWE
ncbi:MAG: hypothetical protein JXA33_13120 [Anaerolineae bacterium]|nr:hypothetical protein [Anaerolineae bacterium]